MVPHRRVATRGRRFSKQGETGYLFFRIIMQPTLSDIIACAKVLETPIASIEEGINAGTFFCGGNQCATLALLPQMDACIDDRYPAWTFATALRVARAWSRRPSK